MGLNRNLGNIPEVIKENGGKIGIGTSSPNYGLNVVSSDITLSGIVSNRFIGIRKTSNTLPGYLGLLGGDNGDNAKIIGYNGSGTQTFEINASTVPTYFNGGYVGIGITNPDAIFTVNKTNTNYTDASAGHILLDNSSSIGQSSIYYRINGTVRGKIRVDQVGNLNYIANGGSHEFWTGGDAGSGSVKMTVGSNGNLIVGVSGGNTGLILRQATSVDRFQIFVGSGGSYIADDNYIKSYNTDLHFLAGATGTTEIMRIKQNGAVSNNGVLTQYASGSANVDTTFYFDFVAYPSTVYKILAGITHWNAGYGAYKESLQFNDAYTTISELPIVNHTSGNGGMWSISRPDNVTLRVTHTAGTFAGGANFWIQVIGV